MSLYKCWIKQKTFIEKKFMLMWAQSMFWELSLTD